MKLNQISSQIIKAAINVHKELGPGLLESVYQKCMAIELSDMDLNVDTEASSPLTQKRHPKHKNSFYHNLTNFISNE